MVGAPTTELLHQLVQAMAPLDAGLVETDWRAVASTVLRRAGHRSLVVLLTGLDPAPLQEGLLPVLPQLAHRHRILVASVSDPRIAELAGGRGDADAVYSAAAAEQAKAARAHLEQVLRRHGVDVVDAPPDALPRRWPMPTSPSRPPAGSEPTLRPEQCRLFELRSGVRWRVSRVSRRCGRASPRRSAARSPVSPRARRPVDPAPRPRRRTPHPDQEADARSGPRSAGRTASRRPRRRPTRAAPAPARGDRRRPRGPPRRERLAPRDAVPGR